MTNVVSSIFEGVGDVFSSLFGGGAGDVQEVVTGPSAQETKAQKEQTELVAARERVAGREREARQRVITARTAGAQTLFKRAEEIPRATKLGGGRRA